MITVCQVVRLGPPWLSDDRCWISAPWADACLSTAFIINLPLLRSFSRKRGFSFCNEMCEMGLSSMQIHLALIGQRCCIPVLQEFQSCFMDAWKWVLCEMHCIAQAALYFVDLDIFHPGKRSFANCARTEALLINEMLDEEASGFSELSLWSPQAARMTDLMR